MPTDPEETSPSSMLASSLDALLNATQDGVVFIDERSNIVRINPAAGRMFGYAAEELIGRPVVVLMGHPYAAEHDGYIERYERTGQARAIGRIRVVSGKRKSGEEFPLELSVTKLDAASGGKYGAFLRDISETVRLQNELVDRERLATVGATASMLAHEIGNPLNNLFLHAQLMQRRLKKLELEDGKLLEALDTCQHEISRLHRLLDEFRALSRRGRLRKESVNLSRLASEVLNQHVALRSGGKISVERELPLDIAVTVGDPDKLKQVVLNLCQNAVEAMPRGGTLGVRSAEENGSVILEVSDTGTGVPEGVDVFEPFVTTKSEGTGLGLAISRQISSAHGGTLTCRGREAGGSTFRLAVPRFERSGGQVT